MNKMVTGFEMDQLRAQQETAKALNRVADALNRIADKDEIRVKGVVGALSNISDHLSHLRGIEKSLQSLNNTIGEKLGGKV